MPSLGSLLMATISAYYSFDMDTYEGKELRKSVLIRNTVKASSSLDISRESIQQQGKDKDKERWMVMAARSGLHPSDYSDHCDQDNDDDDDDDDEEEEEEGCDDEVILLPRIENNDYYDTPIKAQEGGNQIEDENDWFDGLLQEVRAADQAPPSPCSVDDDNDEGQLTMSSTPSLPSLILDEYDDTSEEDEGDEADIHIHTRTQLNKASPTTSLY